MRSTTERRFFILEYLCEHRFETVANLAFEFGVTGRTIRTDIQILSAAFPLYTEQGIGGGVRISDGYRLGKKYLTEEQQDLLERLAIQVEEPELEILDEILKMFGIPGRERRKGGIRKI